VVQVGDRVSCIMTAKLVSYFGCASVVVKLGVQLNFAT
jgi:hypothetical protein